MKDTVTVLMEETGCDRSEAELALELCNYDLEAAVQAVPRLFQNIVVLKARFCARSESLYGLWLAILNLKSRTLLRARAVVSYNPAVYASELDQHWFDFEGRLYACRLWVGTLQETSQEVEQALAAHFAAPEARRFYEDDARFSDEDFLDLAQTLKGRLGGETTIQVLQDVLDMGQFQEVRPRHDAPERAKRAPDGPSLLVLKVALEPDSAGKAASELTAGDTMLAAINDSRDIAQYLGKLFGAITEEGALAVPVPIEAVQHTPSGEVRIRVRFSAGACGDVTVPGDLRLRVVPRNDSASWWKKIFGR